MSQNAVLDRETVSTQAQDASEGRMPPVARLQREHLVLVDWDLAAASRPRGDTPVVPARRPWFGWSEAAAGVLLLASGAACLSSLLGL